jgi:hypothetical protein
MKYDSCIATSMLVLNCTITNVIHKFLICLSIHFCLTCFGLSFSPSSEAGVLLRQWFKSAGYGVTHTGQYRAELVGVSRRPVQPCPGRCVSGVSRNCIVGFNKFLGTSLTHTGQARAEPDGLLTYLLTYSMEQSPS